MCSLRVEAGGQVGAQGSMAARKGGTCGLSLGLQGAVACEHP
jgi:hypothetical protein